MYTIHGVYNNMQAVPFVYAYLPGKSQALYSELFGVIQRKCNGEPKFIISDFEIGAVNAYRETFTSAEAGGCLFHLTQSVYRKVQKLPAVRERQILYYKPVFRRKIAINYP